MGFVIVIISVCFALYIISQLGKLSKGVWLCYHSDWSGLTIFSADEELAARKYANENGTLIEFKKFGEIR